MASPSVTMMEREKRGDLRRERDAWRRSYLRKPITRSPDQGSRTGGLLRPALASISLASTKSGWKTDIGSRAVP